MSELSVSKLTRLSRSDGHNGAFKRLLVPSPLLPDDSIRNIKVIQQTMLVEQAIQVRLVTVSEPPSSSEEFGTVSWYVYILVVVERCESVVTVRAQ